MDNLLNFEDLIEVSHKILDKVNSVLEACSQCFAVHILEFEILQTTWKNKTKSICDSERGACILELLVIKLVLYIGSN